MATKREALLATLGQTMQTQIWQGQKYSTFALEQLGITLPQMIVLLMLERNGGRGTMQELASFTHQSGGTLTGIVDRLLHMELVRREAHPCDRRVVYVALTDVGYACLARITAQRATEFMQITANFSDDELAELDRLMRKLVEGFTTALEQVGGHLKKTE
jgi:DNA-binding MarR family transcriptional regulator